MEFCFAAPSDSRALLDIYTQYIDTPITFQYDLPNEMEFARRIEETQLLYPFLVCRSGQTVLGYAYAHPVRAYEAYQWGAELTIYLHSCATTGGLGTKLYEKLIALLREQGVRTVYGAVTLPNAQSEGLHEKLGFRRSGVWRNAGYKGGMWHDVAWFEKELNPCTPHPEPILPVYELDPERVMEILGQ